MQESSTRRIYDFQSLFYDITFGKLVQRRIASAISHIKIGPSDRLLDLGIGTGAAISYYPRQGKIVGIDLSRGMLAECVKKINRRQAKHVSVFQADALNLPFADDSFDHVFISHVISVVSDPFLLIREAQRVAKPGARIVILNHFQSTNRFVALVEKFLCPLCTKLGWRSDLALQDLIRRTGVEVDYRYRLDSIDLWETVVISNNKSALTGAPPEPSPTRRSIKAPAPMLAAACEVAA
ncbi:MAG: methyltransferase domain-containing protein [Planctomycetota bacterium]|nr:methyltransferase domain-containing protein [Planctomycetota bacterium]